MSDKKQPPSIDPLVEMITELHERMRQLEKEEADTRMMLRMLAGEMGWELEVQERDGAVEGRWGRKSKLVLPHG